ncbi:MAG: hypothetical protein ACR2M1_12390 [Gemmatimonadaceae bacterium]
MATEKIRDWTLTDMNDAQGPALMLERKGRAPVVITYNEGMDREVLLEYATTRMLEAEVRDAGKKVPKALQDAYDQQIEDSRDAQAGRETKRRRAEQRGEVR